MTVPPRLEGHTAHVWHTAPDRLRDPERVRAYLATLSSDERTRHARIRMPAARHEFLVARVLLRSVLSHYADVPPSGWVFRYDEHGRPDVAFPAAHRRLQFNLTHTRDLVACVVGLDDPVGIDAEDARRPVPDSLGARVLSRSELSALRALPPGERQRRFFEYWTLREAYAKARGVGLSLPLRELTFRVDPTCGVRAHFGAPVGDDPAAWQFALFRPSVHHVLAVSVRRPAGASRDLDVIETVPLAA